MSNYGRKNISEVTIVKALKMVEDGYSYSLVAEEIGCNKSLIAKWVKKSGIKPDTKIKKKSKQYDRSITHVKQDWSKVTDLQSLLSQQREQILDEVRGEIEKLDRYGRIGSKINTLLDGNLLKRSDVLNLPSLQLKESQQNTQKVDIEKEDVKI